MAPSKHLGVISYVTLFFIFEVFFKNKNHSRHQLFHIQENGQSFVMSSLHHLYLKQKQKKLSQTINRLFAVLFLKAEAQLNKGVGYETDETDNVVQKTRIILMTVTAAQHTRQNQHVKHQSAFTDVKLNMPTPVCTGQYSYFIDAQM